MTFITGNRCFLLYCSQNFNGKIVLFYKIKNDICKYIQKVINVIGASCKAGGVAIVLWQINFLITLQFDSHTISYIWPLKIDFKLFFRLSFRLIFAEQGNFLNAHFFGFFNAFYP